MFPLFIIIVVVVIVFIMCVRDVRFVRRRCIVNMKTRGLLDRVCSFAPLLFPGSHGELRSSGFRFTCALLARHLLSMLSSRFFLSFGKALLINLLSQESQIIMPLDFQEKNDFRMYLDRCFWKLIFYSSAPINWKVSFS